MDDLISRQAAIDAVNKYRQIADGIYFGLTDTDSVLSAIINLPSAQYIVTTWRSDGLYSLICPVCGYRKVVWTNFCPNCGARMIKGKEERSEND